MSCRQPWTVQGCESPRWAAGLLSGAWHEAGCGRACRMQRGWPSQGRAARCPGAPGRPHCPPLTAAPTLYDPAVHELCEHLVLLPGIAVQLRHAARACPAGSPRGPSGVWGCRSAILAKGSALEKAIRLG